MRNNAIFKLRDYAASLLLLIIPYVAFGETCIKEYLYPFIQAMYDTDKQYLRCAYSDGRHLFGYGLRGKYQLEGDQWQKKNNYPIYTCTSKVTDCRFNIIQS